MLAIIATLALFPGSATHAAAYTTITFASGINGPDGLAFDSSGDLYVADYNGNTVSEITPSGVVSLYATVGSRPAGLAFDSSGNLYVTNFGSGSISKVTPSGTLSNYVNSVSEPIGVAFSSSGYMYVASFGTNSIYAGVNPYLPTPSWVSVTSPTHIAFDSSGNLYTPNFSNNTVSKITPAGIVSTYATVGSEPNDLAFDSAGNLYVADYGSGTISKVTPSGVVSTFASGFSEPFGLAFDSSGDLYVSSLNTGVISEILSASPTCTVSLTPNPLAYGSQSTLSYSSANATSFYINNVGYVGASGSTLVEPAATTDYTGSVGNGMATTTCPAFLTVSPPSTPTAKIAASSTSLYTNQSTNLTATFTAWPGDTLTGDNIDQPYGTGLSATTNPDASKTITFTPTQPGTYVLYAMAQTAYYSSWAQYASTTITVIANPSCTLSLSPTSITQGSSATLSYSSSNASSFSISSIGSETPNTSSGIQVSPAQTTTYTGTVASGGATNYCTASLPVSCEVSWSCNGNSIVQTNANCSTQNLTTCASPYYCQSGSNQCLAPSIAFNSSGNLTGDLQIVPNIVASGESAKVYWSVSDAEGCIVTGTNSDSWTGLSGSETTKSITAETNYRLQCTAYGNNPNVTQTATILVTPKFEEQ